MSSVEDTPGVQTRPAAMFIDTLHVPPETHRLKEAPSAEQSQSPALQEPDETGVVDPEELPEFSGASGAGAGAGSATSAGTSAVATGADSPVTVTGTTDRASVAIGAASLAKTAG